MWYNSHLCQKEIGSLGEYGSYTNPGLVIDTLTLPCLHEKLRMRPSGEEPGLEEDQRPRIECGANPDHVISIIMAPFYCTNFLRERTNS